MTNDLIISIGKQLNIPKSDDNEWICQIVYSVAGQMALASLWDHSEDSNSVSVSISKIESTKFLMHMRVYTLKLDSYCQKTEHA